MPSVLPLEDYVAHVLSSLKPLKPTCVPLAHAHGLVLAQDAAAALAVPPWTNSAMDGYALRAQDVSTAGPDCPVSLPVSGDVPAGSAPRRLEPGTAQRIMTGAVLPEGADAVVRVEDTDQRAGPAPLPRQVLVRSAVEAGDNVRVAGEDVEPGSPVLKRGSVLSSCALAALAATGHAEVLALPRPRVAVVTTGAELVDPGTRPGLGKLPDSNALLVSGLVREHGAAVSGTWRCDDTPESASQALADAAKGCDLVITTGGVSAGAFDPLTMLASAPQDVDGVDTAGTRLTFAEVAMQPGKPQGHGTVRAPDGRSVPLIMLPGNPVSVLVSFVTIAVPALARLSGHDGHAAGQPSASPDRSLDTARAAASWTSPQGRRQHVPVRLVEPPAGTPAGLDRRQVETSTWVEPTHRLGSGSHLVASLPAAQALAVVEAGVDGVEVGTEVGLISVPTPAAPVRHRQGPRRPRETP